MINNDKNLERCRNEWLEPQEDDFDRFEICSDCIHSNLCEYHEIEPDDLGVCVFYDRIAKPPINMAV